MGGTPSLKKGRCYERPGPSKGRGFSCSSRCSRSCGLLVPAKAERVAGGIRVDLEALGRLEVVGRFQEPRAQRDCFLMRRLEIVDMQVEMHLLRRPVGPIGGNMVRRELNAEPPLAVDQHTVPIVLRYDRAAQQTCPEGALGGQIGSV